MSNYLIFSFEGLKSCIWFCATCETEFETIPPRWTWSSGKWLFLLCWWSVQTWPWLYRFI